MVVDPVLPRSHFASTPASIIIIVIHISIIIVIIVFIDITIVVSLSLSPLSSCLFFSQSNWSWQICFELQANQGQYLSEAVL